MQYGSNRLVDPSKHTGICFCSSRRQGQRKKTPAYAQRIAFAIFLALLSGCAGASTSTDAIQIKSDPPGAEARTSAGQSCTTPCTIYVMPNDEFIVYFIAPGYQLAEVSVRTKQLGSALMGYVKGSMERLVPVDSNSHIPNPVYARLVPYPVNPKAE